MRAQSKMAASTADTSLLNVANELGENGDSVDEEALYRKLLMQVKT